MSVSPLFLRVVSQIPDTRASSHANSHAKNSDTLSVHFSLHKVRAKCYTSCRIWLIFCPHSFYIREMVLELISTKIISLEGMAHFSWTSCCACHWRMLGYRVDTQDRMLPQEHSSQTWVPATFLISFSGEHIESKGYSNWDVGKLLLFMPPPQHGAPI